MTGSAGCRVEERGRGYNSPAYRNGRNAILLRVQRDKETMEGKVIKKHMDLLSLQCLWGVHTKGTP